MNPIYYIEVDNTRYPSISIDGRMHDEAWDNRESKTFRLEIGYAEAASVFTDGIKWNIVSETSNEETNEIVTDIFDNSAFNVAGDITDHRDGTVSITMGKMTDLEEAYELLYGGEL